MMAFVSNCRSRAVFCALSARAKMTARSRALFAESITERLNDELITVSSSAVRQRRNSPVQSDASSHFLLGKV
jgi:hypothetical protein